VGAVSWLSYQVGLRLVKATRYSLPNVIAGRELVRELIQHELTVENLLSEVRSLLFDSARREKMKGELRRVRESLGEGGASARAARAVHRRLGEAPGASDHNDFAAPRGSA
jgi:lipid-A-disaccharide synthase